MSKILVTGGTGFIGVPLVKQLHTMGHEVKLLVRERSKITPFNELKNIAYVKGDVTDYDSLIKAFEGVDLIYHLAGYVKIWAKDKATYDRINVEGTENVAKVALTKQIPLVYVSSFGALGPNPLNGSGMPCDESFKHVDFFQNDYERTKYNGTEKVKTYIQKGLNCIIFYPGFVYGQGDFNIYGEMMLDIVAGQFLGCPGKGESLFCMAYLEDVINGLTSVIGRTDLYGQGFMLGGENVKINDYLNLIAEIANKKKPRHFPFWGGVTFAKFCKFKAELGSGKRIPYITPDMVEGMKYNWAYCSDKAIKTLNYKITPLKEALPKTIEWYKQLIESQGKNKKKLGVRVN